MRKITITKLIGAILLLGGMNTNMYAQAGLGDASGIGAEYFTKERALRADEIVEGKVIAIKSANEAGQNSWMDFHKTNSSSEHNLSDKSFNYKNIFTVETGANGGIILKRKSDNKYLGTNDMVDEKTSAQEVKVIRPRTNGTDIGDPYIFTSDNTWYPTWGDPTTEETGTSPYLLRFVKYNDNTNTTFLNANNNYFATGNGSWSVFYAVEVSDYPFSPSEEPNSDAFSANTNWYYLKIDTDEGDTQYASYTTTGTDDNQISLTSTNPISYGSLWAFVQTNDGKIQIYNAAAGTDKVLSIADALTVSNNSGYQLKMRNKDAGNNTWESVIESSRGYLQFKMQYENNVYYINHLGQGKVLGSKVNATGAWSDLMLEPVVFDETAAQTVIKDMDAVKGYVGTLTDDAYNQVIEEFKQGTKESFLNALKIKDVTGSTIPLDSKKFYRLRNVYRSTSEANTNQYMLGADASGLIASEMNNKDASLLWKIETPNEESNTVKLYHANAQKEAEAIGGAGDKDINLTTEGADYTITQWSPDQYGFKIGSNYLIEFAGNTIGSWNGGGEGSDHAWYIIPAENINIDITAVGYATVNYPFAVQLPSEDNNIKAYTGTLNNAKNELILNEVKNGLIPAGTPVVLVSTRAKEEQSTQTYTLNIVADDTTPSISENALSGSLLSTDITTEDYILSTYENVVGFYKLVEDGTLAANKAYLSGNTINPTGVQGVRGFTLSFNDNNGTTTNIEGSTISPKEEPEEYYDLQGRRVLNPTKGIYVTKSGKKVLRLK